MTKEQYYDKVCEELLALCAAAGEEPFKPARAEVEEFFYNGTSVLLCVEEIFDETT